jgi:hypothetical protein
VASLFSGEEIPDLVNLPGARVLRGRDRDKAGASATPHRDEDFFSDSPR